MKYSWLDGYLLSKHCAEKEFKAEWNAYRYLIAGKVFAMQGGDKDGNSIITLKLEPDFGKFLRQTYKGEIVPGYYMNKEHWNSLYLAGSVPDDVVKQMVDESYRLIFMSLSKKMQSEILSKQM